MVQKHDANGGRMRRGRAVDTDAVQQCLSLLREADDMLMANDELALAVHLSLVIERLALRLPERALRLPA